MRDSQKAIRVAGGNAELAQKLFDKFRLDLPLETELIHQYASLYDWEKLRETAHRLSGSAAICAVISLNQIVKDIEIAAIEKQENDINLLLIKLTEEVKLIMDDTAKAVEL